MRFCCLWRNVQANSWHKHFVIRLPRSTNSAAYCYQRWVTNVSRFGGTVFITPDGRSVDNTRWSEILVENSDFFLPHLLSMPLLMGYHQCCYSLSLTLSWSWSLMKNPWFVLVFSVILMAITCWATPSYLLTFVVCVYGIYYNDIQLHSLGR